MKNTYYSLINTIDRMYRLFLDLVKKELDLLHIHDINNIQAMMVYNIADKQVSVGELISRGLYNGSNVSYNLKKLIKTGYVIQTPSEHDKRSLNIKLSTKGKAIYEKIDQCLERHAESLKISLQGKKNLEGVLSSLQTIEAFWSQSNFSNTYTS